METHSRSRLFLAIKLKTMLTFDDAERLLQDVTYLNGWYLKWVPVASDSHFAFMQWVFWDDEGKQECRRWLLDLHEATESDIVQTALRAALDAAEHEARENFRFRNKRIYGPHFNPEALVEFSRYKENLSIREKWSYPFTQGGTR